MSGGSNELQKKEQTKIFLIVGRKCQKIYIEHGKNALMRRGMCSGQELQENEMRARVLPPGENLLPPGENPIEVNNNNNNNISVQT